MRSHAALIAIYKADGHDYLRQIGEALALGDAAAAILPAHTLKSSSTIIGASEMARLAAELELRLHKEEALGEGGVHELAARLDRVFLETLAEIDRHA